MSRTRRQYTANEIRVGLFVIIPVIVLFLVVALKLGYSLHGSTMDIYLKVDSIKSIKKGTLVQVKGYEIGRIVDIVPVYKPTLHFLAVMRVRRDVDIYENSAAIIQNQNIIGDAVIEIINPEMTVAYIQNGDVIEGIEYVSLDRVLQDVSTLLASFTGAADEVTVMVNETNRNLRDLMGSLNDGVDSLNRILESSQGDLIETMASFRKTAQTMEEISVELKKHPLKFLMR